MCCCIPSAFGFGVLFTIRIPTAVATRAKNIAREMPNKAKLLVLVAGTVNTSRSPEVSLLETAPFSAAAAETQSLVSAVQSDLHLNAPESKPKSSQLRLPKALVSH